MDDTSLSFPRRPGWHRLAACATVPSSVFFSATVRATARARRVCASCEVRQRCLDDALRRRDEHGIWGGLTPDERAALWSDETVDDGHRPVERRVSS